MIKIQALGSSPHPQFMLQLRPPTYQLPSPAYLPPSSALLTPLPSAAIRKVLQGQQLPCEGPPGQEQEGQSAGWPRGRDEG